MSLTDQNRRQMGRVQPHAESAAAEICARWPCAYVWGFADKPGEHGKGLAIDFSVLAWGKGPARPGGADPDKGDAIAAYALRNRRRLGVYYVIWNRRIASAKSDPAWGWRPYSGASPHTDHVHVSFHPNHAYSPPPQEEPQMPTAKEIARVLLWLDEIPNQSNRANPKMTLAGAISDIEKTQDDQRRELAEIKRTLAAISAKVGA